MRFELNYTDYKDKSVKNKNITLLEVFLNFHLVEDFHGWSFECLCIYFRNNAPGNKNNTAKKYLDSFAKIEINGIFESNRTYNLQDFYEGFQRVKEAIQLADQIVIKQKDYDVHRLLHDLEKLQAELPKTEEELIQLSSQEQAMCGAIADKRIEGYLKASKEHPLPQKTRLLGVRIYPSFKEVNLLPYSYVYSEIFSTLLRNENILTPYYKEIYFTISSTIEEAKTNSPLMIQYWHKYTYCALDIDLYNTSSEEVKNKMVLQSLCDGLRFIVDIDHLDKEKTEKVIQRVEIEGMNLLLTFRTKENKLYRVDVVYTVIPDHTQLTPFYLLLTDKSSGKSYKAFINNFHLWGATYSFGKITITKNEIIITGHGGLRGQAYREFHNLPYGYKFNIGDFMRLEA